MDFDVRVLLKMNDHVNLLEHQATTIRDVALETASEYPQISEILVWADPARSGVFVRLLLSVTMPEYGDEIADDFFDAVVDALNHGDRAGALSGTGTFLARQTLVAV